MNITRFVTLFVVALAACSPGEQTASASESAQSPDTTIKPLERTPLTAADLEGLEPVDVSIEVPWTRNTVIRSATPQAARSLVQSVVVSSHEGFDRAVFTLSSDAAFPGYDIEMVEPRTAITCGEVEEGDSTVVEHAPAVEGRRFLVLRLTPARTRADGRTTVPTGAEVYALPRILEAGVTCAENDIVTWIAGLAGLADGTEVRVLEMRSPQRLVVDVR